MPMLNTPEARREGGFAMVALLVGMAVAAVWMTAALPAWRQQVQRQKEDDLIFRGEQYARAIVLYQQKNRGANPPSVDVLVSGHYLRKKWKDPITGKDFFLVGNGIQQPSSFQGSSQQQQPGRGGQPNQQTQQGQQPGITGVRSESTATSIKIYQNQQQYSLWQFDARLMEAKMVRQQQQAGGGQPQGGNRGGQQPGRGGPQQGTPGRGGQPGAPGGPVRSGGPVGGPTGGGPGGAPPGRAGGS